MRCAFEDFVTLTTRDGSETLDRSSTLDIDCLKDKLVDAKPKIGFGVTDGSFDCLVEYGGGTFFDKA